MKKLISVIVALTMVLCSASSAFACAGIYVGNDAAENGSTYFARSEDFGSDYTKIFGVAPSRNIGEGEVYEDSYGFTMSYSEFGLTGDTHKYTYIKDSPENGETPVSPGDGEAYAEAGINDSGVFVSATVSTNYMATWYGTDCASMDADPLVDTGICEISIGSILLAHSGSAKEGVDLLAKIIDKYGAGECNSLTIGDQNETWYFEIVSGHQYAAVKMPKDNSVAIQPNIMLLGVIDVADTENVVASKDLVSLAQEKGFLVTDEDGKIDVAKSYAEVNSGAAQYQRYYQGLFYINKEEAQKYDGVLDQDKLATFNNNTDGLPFMNTPDRQLSTMDIFKLQATRGEGTKFDANESDSYSIGNENQSECHVFETRKDMAPQLATIQWQAMGPAEYSIYIPYYSALISNVYGLYDVESTESVDYSMFWVFSDIYQLCSKDRTNNGAAVKAYFEKYQESLIEQQKTVDTEMAALYAKDPEAAAEMADMLGMDLAQQTYKIAAKVLDELEAYDAQKEKDAPMVLSDSITGFMPVYSTEHASAPADAVPEGEAVLLAGDENVADEDALVMTIVGDGFTKFEQEKFFSYAQNTADYIMNTSPWNEFPKNVKIYGVGVASNQSGVRGEHATSVEEAEADDLDTYFQSSYWMYNTERIVYIDEYGEKKLNDLMKDYCPSSEFQIMLVNSEKVGGAGGDQYCVFSIDPDVYECAVHELGHTVGNLADEYWSDTYAKQEDETDEEYEAKYANISMISDPEKVSWSKFIGINGIGVYEHSGNGKGYYRPSQNCKMQYLGEQYEFCEVCKEQLRKRISELSNIATISFQTYGEKFYVNPEGTGTDLTPYFVLRQGSNSVAASELSSDLFTLTYTDSDGNVVEGIPNKKGTYTVTAEFAGNDTYSACSLETEYTINYPNYINVTVESKTFDGAPVDVDYKVTSLEADTYNVELSYTGTVKNAYSKTYDSDKAPAMPGSYTVTATVTDKQTGEVLSDASEDFSIESKITQVVNNNDPEYPGACAEGNNKAIVIMGEGFTAEEQDKFEQKASEFIDRFLDTEPLKDAKSYFNIYTVETVSEKSGIGTQAGDTYFGTSYDENGRVRENYYASVAASRIAYYDTQEYYYPHTIILVNDENVKEGTTDNSYAWADGRVIYCAADKSGTDYAIQSYLNYWTGYDSPQTAEDKEAQKLAFAEYALYVGGGLTYAPMLLDAYKADFVEGTPVDLTDYIHTYLGSTEVPADLMEYNITYYADDNGAVGDKLEAAPSKAGKYHAFVETVANDEYDWGPSYGNYKEAARIVDISGDEYYLAKTRNWTTFTVKPAVAKVKPTVSLAKGTTRGIKVTVTVPEEQKADKTGIIIYRSKSKDSGYVKYKSVAVSGASYTITNTKDAKGNYLTEGTRYYYKAKAYAVIDGKTYYGPMSDVKSLTPKITDVKATVSLSTKNISRGIKVTVKVPETQKAEKKGFIIYRSTKKDSGYVKYKTVDTRKASYSIVNTKNAAGNRLVKGKTYYYKVKTYKVVNGHTYYGTMSPVKYIKAK